MHRLRRHIPCLLAAGVTAVILLRQPPVPRVHQFGDASPAPPPLAPSTATALSTAASLFTRHEAPITTTHRQGPPERFPWRGAVALDDTDPSKLPVYVERTLLLLLLLLLSH